MVHSPETPCMYVTPPKLRASTSYSVYFAILCRDNRGGVPYIQFTPTGLQKIHVNPLSDITR